MACGATLSLKRSLEFDPLHSPSHKHSPKRRRCMPMTMSPSTPPTKQNQNPSPFLEVSPKLSSEHIAAQISAEIKRMHRRKQLQFPGQSTSPPSPTESPMPCSSQGPDPADNRSTSPSAFFNAISPSKKEMPLFTFKQVSMVCERMIKEREDHIRHQYDQVLTCKLAEQYEAFLKFNHDQLRRRFTNESAASYVS